MIFHLPQDFNSDLYKCEFGSKMFWQNSPVLSEGIPLLQSGRWRGTLLSQYEHYNILNSEYRLLDIMMYTYMYIKKTVKKLINDFNFEKKVTYLQHALPIAVKLLNNQILLRLTKKGQMSKRLHMI